VAGPDFPVSWAFVTASAQDDNDDKDGKHHEPRHRSKKCPPDQGDNDKDNHGGNHFAIQGDNQGGGQGNDRGDNHRDRDCGKGDDGKNP